MNGEIDNRYITAIRHSGLTIYDHIDTGDPDLWIPTITLEKILGKAMTGISLFGLPLRTRSKLVKENVCKSLGYPIPSNFKKTRPRFPGQNFNTYVQKSNNLQIWNEEIVPSRRYVIFRINPKNVITRIRAITGHELSELNTTGTLTQKFQAGITLGDMNSELVSNKDTEHLQPYVSRDIDLVNVTDSVAPPQENRLLSIHGLFVKLQNLIGIQFADSGHDQERNRGAALHRLVTQYLGYTKYRDDGQFPDIPHQLLEIKLQTAPTIDLGLVCPDSEEVLDLPKIGGKQIRHRDIRYAIFYANRSGGKILITHLFLTTGEKFFTRFPRFEGKILNRKLQIPLPDDFFFTESE